MCKKEKAVLLSGDKDLRKAAQIEKVTCRGTLWFLEELVLNNVFPPTHAALLLERMVGTARVRPPTEPEIQHQVYGLEVCLVQVPD